MIVIKKAFALAAFLLASCVLGECIQAGTGVSAQEPLEAKQGQISLTISAIQGTVSSGLPVNVKIVATNISTEAVYIAFTDQYIRAAMTYRANILDDHGNIPPDTILNRTIKYYHAGINVPHVILTDNPSSASLNPGQAFTDTIDLGTVYDLSQPGKYTVQIDRLDTAGQIEAISNTITINITPAQNGPQANAATSTQPLSVAIQMLPSDSVSRGTQVALKIITANISDHTITLWADTADNRQGDSTYQLSIRAADGSVPADTPMGRQQKARTDVPRGAGYSMTSAATKGQRFALRPGESWTDTVMLNELYDLNKPGQYTIQVRRFDPATGTMVTSNDITLTIAP